MQFQEDVPRYFLVCLLAAAPTNDNHIAIELGKRSGINDKAEINGASFGECPPGGNASNKGL